MKIYFTLTGTNHWCGQNFLKKGMKVKLKKESDNKFDKEDIKVSLKGLGQIGYVAIALILYSEIVIVQVECTIYLRRKQLEKLNMCLIIGYYAQ